jgi:hypothetical protein
MSLYPNTKSGKIGYFNSKVAPWNASATQIGTTTAAVTALQTKITAAQDKLDAQIAAEQAAKTATAAADAAVAAMVAAGMDIVKDIRATAASSTDPASIYEMAEIPAPATPTGVTTLGQAYDFSVELDASGALNLKWKCSSPRASGVVYQIYRRIDPTGEFAYIGGCGTKSFTDATVPAGSSQVTYQIQAVRSTAVGPWAQFNVNFGTGSSSGTVMSVTEGKPSKIAA